LLIHQAIFSSAQTDRQAGYQLLGSSEGAAAADLRELSVWGPSHDSLLPEAGGSSTNFHHLPSGAYCVSLTTAAGAEYSGRGGARIHTHCLIVPAEVLARFSNNPFAVLKAAMAKGVVRPAEDQQRELVPFPLPGRASSIDQNAIRELMKTLGPRKLAWLLESVRDVRRAALVGAAKPQRVIEGLLNCLPIAARPEFTFTTGLRFSPRRPFRILGLCPEAAEQRSLERQHNTMVLNLAIDPPAQFIAGYWAEEIATLIEAAQYARLRDVLETEPQGVSQR